MIRRLKQLFTSKIPQKRDFSDFFDTASTEDKKRLMEDLARKANEDQRALIEDYKRMN